MTAPNTPLPPDFRRRAGFRAFQLRALACSTFLAVALATSGCNSLAADAPMGGPDLGLLEDAMHQVERSYVATVQPNQLVDGALKGMLSKLDPHSDYMTEREYRELVQTTTGQFGGIGIEISVEEGVPQVISAIEGTPAASAGIEP